MNGSNADWNHELYSQLMASFGGELHWGEEAGRRKQSALMLREQALVRLSREGRKAARLPLTKVAELKTRGRPRKMDYYEEFKIAVFFAHRKVSGKLGKNALADACRKFGVSRATMFRIQNKHKARAELMASVILRYGRKRFKRVIDVEKRVTLPDFSDWGSDRY